MLDIRRFIKTLFWALTGMLLVAGSAYAQATRTWVSGVGDDANPCSRTAPCKTFAGAISKTAAGGEINVLDPGGFGAVTITKAISIIADHVEAGVLVSGTNGIVVNVGPSDTVILDGLDIEGLGTGIHGVHIIGSGSVVILRSKIRHFTGNAVNLAAAGVNTRLFIQDSHLTLNGGGVSVSGAGGVPNNAIIDRTTIDNHANFGVSISSPGAVFLSASQLIGGSTPKLAVSGGGQMISYGNNIIRAPTGPSPSLLPLQ